MILLCLYTPFLFQSNELRTKSREEKILLEARIEEVEEEAASAKEELSRKEETHAERIKTIEKELESLAGGGVVGERIVHLENCLAEAEEERGALQIKLVDLDDIYGKDCVAFS